MLFPEEDAPLLKTWIVKRIEKTSDADAEVLAEYIIALLKHDGDKGSVRELCEQEIPDFLTEDSKVFLDDVFQTIAYKSYLPGAPPPPKPRAQAPPISPHPPQAPAGFNSGAKGGFSELPPPSPSLPPPPPHPRGSRKRGRYEDLDAPPGENGHPDAYAQGHGYGYGYGPRPMKEPRRGGGGRGRGRDDGGRFGDFGYPSHQPPPPLLDPREAMDAFMAMAGMPGPQPRPGARGGGGGGRGQARRRVRCRDYDTKGYCSRGNTCLFDHGNGVESSNDLPYAPPPGAQFDEGNPANTVIPVPMSVGMIDHGPFPFDAGRDRGGGRKRGSRREGRRGGGGGRAPFSAEGPVHDRSKSTIVVENIPEENFSEDQVRDFFSQFGAIVEVSMQPYKHLAVVKYERWGEANAAYQSPKAIFENRFVRVFWLKDGVDITAPSAAYSNGNGHGNVGNGYANGHAGSDGKDAQEPQLDPEEFRQRQDEAQKHHEEREAKRIAIEQERLALMKKQQDLLSKHREESQRLQEKLAEKNGDEPTIVSTGTSMLRAKLAALEQEAKILGIDTSTDMDDGISSASPYSPTPYSPRGGGRGGFGGAVRGRGRGRGGGRGSFRGHGGSRHAAYAQFSLDNRPKRVAIAGVDFTDPEKDESLRHFLLSLGEFESVEFSPEVTYVSFQDRKTAEKLYYSLHGKELPGVDGKLELSWASGPAGGSSSSSLAATAGDADAPSTRMQVGVAIEIDNDGVSGLDAEEEEEEEEEEGEVLDEQRVAEDMDYEQPADEEEAWG